MGAVYPVRPLFPDGPAPSQAQGDTSRDNTGASSPALESAPAVTTAVSQSTQAWMFLGQGVLICTAWRCPSQESPRHPVPSLLPPVPGGPQDPGLQGLWSSACRVWPALPWGAPPLLVTPGTWGLHCPPGILPEFSVSAFPSGKIGKVTASGKGGVAFLSRGFHHLALARLL